MYKCNYTHNSLVLWRVFLVKQLTDLPLEGVMDDFSISPNIRSNVLMEFGGDDVLKKEIVITKFNHKKSNHLSHYPTKRGGLHFS